jgi:hypothetical protein
MRGLRSAALAVLLGLAVSSSASAGPVLVSGLTGLADPSNPWAEDHDQTNMDNVFGAGNWTLYSSYASATPGAIFTPETNFVMLEGGADTDIHLQNYLSTNGADILAWVEAGGRLLVMSAGWNISITGFGPGTLVFDDYATAADGGKPTAAGAALDFEPMPDDQTGHSLAHDYVTGDGLTTLLNGYQLSSPDSLFPIVAGISYGDGYITYAGLTDSQFHNSGDCLVDNVVAYTAGVQGPGPQACIERGPQNVPEPGSLAVFGAGMALLLVRRRRHA